MRRYPLAILLLILFAGTAAYAQTEPVSADDFVNRGKARIAKRDREGAIRDFTRAIELNPRHANAYHQRGFLRHEDGDWDGTIADYSKVIELSPHFAAAFCFRASAKYFKDERDGAIADATRAIEIDPKYADAYGLRGSARHGKRDLEGAIADYTKAIELNPKLALAYTLRSLARKETGDLEGALADNIRVLELRPKERQGLVDSMWIFMYMGKGEGAYKNAVDSLRQQDLTDGLHWTSTHTVIAGYLGLKQSRKDAEARAFLDEWSKRADSSRCPQACGSFEMRSRHPNCSSCRPLLTR